MKSGVEKVMGGVAALIVGYACGTMGEQIVQGQLQYLDSNSLTLQLVASACVAAVLFTAMLRIGARTD